MIKKKILQMMIYLELKKNLIKINKINFKLINYKSKIQNNLMIFQIIRKT